MKHFYKLAALLLGAAMIFGFAGCANSSNSDDTENVVYTVKNSTGSEMVISYKNKSDVYVNEKTIPANGTYEVPASDAIVIIDHKDPFSGVMSRCPVIYFKVNDTELYAGTAILEKGAKVTLNGEQPQITSL